MEEKDKFNWGAFLLGWIWGLFHKSYITLWQIPLSFIPHIGGFISFFLSIYFGFKGNEWALEKIDYKSIKDFQKSQKKFAIAGLIFYTIAITLYMFFAIVLIMNELHPAGYDFSISTKEIQIVLCTLLGIYIFLILMIILFSRKVFNRKAITIFLIICGLILNGLSFFSKLSAHASESVRPAQAKTYDWGYYMRGLQRKVRPNLVITNASDTQKVTISFNINKRGEAADLKIIKSSGNQKLDTAALAAIEKSSPFAPLPAWYKGEGICVNFYAGKLVLGSSIKSEY